MKINDDTMKEILFKEGLDSLLTAIKNYNTDRYFEAYNDGYIKGRGIGYQRGKEVGYQHGYAKAVQTIMKED